MRPLRLRSIRARLVASLLGLLVLAAAAVGLVTYRNVLAEAESLFDYQLKQMALSLRDQGEIGAEQAGPLADEELDFVVQIWTVDGRSIYASRRHPALPARALLGFATLAVRGQAWRTFSVATPSRVIQVAQPVQIRERLAAHAAFRGVLPLLLLLPIAGLGGGWLAARNLAPLARLAKDVGGRDERSLEPLPTHGLPDEVAPLVAALNAWLGRLRTALDTQRAFVADAAHELRSPLTALKLQVELLRRSPPAASTSERHRDASTSERDLVASVDDRDLASLNDRDLASSNDRDLAIADLVAGIDRASRLVEQLLALARSDPGDATLPMTSVDLAEIVRREVAATVPFAASRGVEFALDAAAPVTVEGDATGLGLLARNLLDNAARHAARRAPNETGGASADGRVASGHVGDERSADGRIEVSVATVDGAAELVVDDAGPGIDEAERSRVFDRFYRPAGSAEAGSGLGLAIVAGIAAQHGARVVLSGSSRGGLRVRVRFPTPGDAPAVPATAARASAGRS